MTWTAKSITKKRNNLGYNTTMMGGLLGMSRPTYERLEKGVSIEKYADRLDRYYNNGYTFKQKKILKELGLDHLIKEKENE